MKKQSYKKSQIHFIAETNDYKIRVIHLEDQDGKTAPCFTDLSLCEDKDHKKTMLNLMKETLAEIKECRPQAKIKLFKVTGLEEIID